ncbi:MAG: hypothetical protein JRI25_26030 [Deltaproteobacteria bacterium]|nr:hypothetical protein [Deltaproteobacteria bacterium]MBW2258040.1 hypothetical protein [Deltaproteobacteria bacterium]
MSSTTHDLVLPVDIAPSTEPSALSEVLEMVGDAFAPAPAATHVERVEATLYKVLFASAMLVASYGLFLTW